MRVVGGLTTIPSRIDEIEKTLVSIADQSRSLDAVYLSIPYTSQREETEYAVPDVLSNYCHIIRCQDYGPITKLIGVLLQEDDPDTIMITFDDDKIYPQGLVEKLLSKHRDNPEAAIGSSGFKIGTFPFYMSTIYNEHGSNGRWFTFDTTPQGDLVDVLYSSPGALYLRKFFPDADNLDKLLRYTTQDANMFRNSDVVISGVLNRAGVERRVYKMPQVTESGNDSNGLQSSRPDYAFSLIKAIYKARGEKLFKKQVGYEKNKTMTFPMVVTIAVTIIFSILVCIRRRGLI